jgi:hypothetical protein
VRPSYAISIRLPFDTNWKSKFVLNFLFL